MQNLNHILHTRIIPGKPPQSIVRRELLLNKISENIKKSLILICSPAGYGKTTLIQDFLAGQDIKYSWLHVQSDMDNFYTFISYLTHSIEQLNPDFGKGTLALMEDYRTRLQLTKNLERIVKDITEIFLNEFCKYFREDIIVVIDDLGNIENSDWQNLLFNTIFENIPPNLHFFVTTRQIPEFTLSTLQAKRNILKIDARDLSFNNKEIYQLLKNNYNINCTENDTKILKDNLDGWITGIHLILQSYGSNFTKLRLDKIIILDDIFNYFTEDIFNDLDTDIQEFLLKTSSLENFSVELCDTLFGTSGSKKIINSLLNKNIFIQINPITQGDTEQTYSYQVLFKKFLNKKLNELKSKKEINDFLSNISKHYLSRKNYVQAINYALNAQDINSAVPLIINQSQNYFDRGNFEVIWKWFEHLEDSVIEQNSELLYFKSLMLRFYRGSTEESLLYIDKAIQISKKSEDSEFLVKYYISKSRNLISLGRVTEAIKNLSEVLNKKTDSGNKAKLLFLTAYAYYQNSDYDKSLALLDKAINELENSIQSQEIKDVQLDIYNLYGHIYLIRGEYSKSISYYEQVAKKGDKIIDKYETLCNLILLYSKSGKFDKALHYLTDTKEISEKISIPIFRITYLLAFQALKFEFGDYEDNIKLLEEMNDIASKLNHKYYIFLSYFLIGDSYYSMNKLSKSEEYYDLAFKYLNDESKFEKIQYSFMKALLLKKNEIIPSIESVLLEAYEYYSKYKLTYDKTQVAFHLSDFYLKINNLHTAYKYLSEALSVSHEKEYISYLQRDLADFRYVFDFALANDIQKDFIKLIIDSLLHKKETEWISEECKKRLEVTTSSFYDIRLNLFGKGEIIVRGKTIEENEWTKKKWKLIFIYLMLSPKKELTKDKIIDFFYPDTPAESADNIFHQVISKFRNLLKINTNLSQESDKKNKSKKKSGDGLKLTPPLVIYEDKVLKINDDLIFNIDSNDFEKYYRKTSAEKDKKLKMYYLKNAINIHKGDFLEGNYETWCEEMRTRYHSYFISLSEELIKMLFEDGDYPEALNYSENLLRYDKLNLTSYEYTIMSYENINKHRLAREKYSQLIKNFKTEYGENPPNNLTERLEKVLK